MRLCVRVAFAAVCPGFWISKSAEQKFGGTRSVWFPRLFDLPTDLHAGGPCCSIPVLLFVALLLTIPSACTQRRVSARLCAVWMPIGIHLGVHGGTDMTGRTHLFGHEYSSQTFVGRHKQQGADFHDSNHPNNHCQQQAKRSMSHPLIHFQQAMPWRDDVEQGRQRSRPRQHRTAVLWIADRQAWSNRLPFHGSIISVYDKPRGCRNESLGKG